MNRSIVRTIISASAFLMISGCRTSTEKSHEAPGVESKAPVVEAAKMSTPTPAMTPVPGQVPPICETWADPVQVGLLETSSVDEASGLEAYGGELIHINDSGDGPYVYVSARDGKGTRKFTIDGFKPRDVEDITVGKCGLSEPCLYVADIGDNKEKRKDIEIIVLPTSAISALNKKPSEPIKPLRKLRLRYPDRAHNAEAIAITPKGNLVIVTKEMDKKNVAQPAYVFFLPVEKVLASQQTTHTLTAAGLIDIPKIVKGTSFDGLVTSMDITDAGDRVVLLTYQRAVEFNWRFDDDPLRFARAEKDKKDRVDFHVLELKRLNQQEAICYDENQQDLLYDTEAWGLPGILAANAELMLVKCQKPSSPNGDKRK